MRVAYNPVLDAEGNSNFVDNHLGQYSHTFNIGYLGRISPQKGIRHLVLLMRELGADASMPISLHIAGPVQDEDYFRIVEDEVKSFNQAAGPLSICICGPVPSGQAVAFYRKMNLAIFPSLCHEGFSLSVLEAMVAQTPIVAYRSGGTAEALEFGKLGILVNRGEVSELVEATRQLLRDAQAASQMAVEAREAALKKYTLAAHVTSLLRS